MSLSVIPPLCPHASHTPSAGMGIMPVVGASQYMNVKYVYSPRKLSQFPSPPPASGSFSVVASWGTPGRDLACSAYLPPSPLTLLVAGMTDHPCSSLSVRPLLSLPQLRNVLSFWPKVICHTCHFMWVMAWSLHHLRVFRLHVVAKVHSLLTGQSFCWSPRS